MIQIMDHTASIFQLYEFRDPYSLNRNMVSQHLVLEEFSHVINFKHSEGALLCCESN